MSLKGATERVNGVSTGGNGMFPSSVVWVGVVWVGGRRSVDQHCVDGGVWGEWMVDMCVGYRYESSY